MMELLSIKPLTVEDCLSRMNEIQRHAYDGTITRAERDEFRALYRKITEQSYTVHKRTIKSCGRRVATEWYATNGVRESRNTECEWIKTNVRPNDGFRTLKGDCTTRAMSFCLEGVMTYREIEKLQYSLAAKMHTRRNSRGTWDIVIRDRGWIQVNLLRHTKRSVIARILRGSLTKPCISQSSGHVAVIDTEGRVRDTWDSRGGIVRSLYVFGSDYGAVDRALGQYGIRCQPILNQKSFAA